jgi:hypothetical protein
MIIGAIEEVEPNAIAGWIHSRSANLRDATVLAYLDGKCVGSGRVGLFREDLQAAGLGDGHLGFRFGITVPRASDALRVTVTLEGCEAMLLQADVHVGSRLTPRPASEFVAGVLPPEPVRAWRRDRGWLDAGTADLLATLEGFGAVTLPIDASRQAPADCARDLIEAVTMAPVEIVTVDLGPIKGMRARLLDPAAPWANTGLFVLSAERRLTLRVVEMADCSPETLLEEADLAGALDYPVDHRSLLAVRRWVHFAPGRMAGEGTLRLHYPMAAAQPAVAAQVGAAVPA